MARTPTTKHTQGLLKAIGHTKPGQVIYMRPDHASYDPKYFAIVLRNDVIVLVRYVMSMGLITQHYQVNDSQRCVEIVSQDLAASSCGISQRDMKALTDQAKRTTIESKTLRTEAARDDGDEPIVNPEYANDRNDA